MLCGVLWNQRMVPGNGIEPSRYFYRGILSPLRLPISPPGLFCWLKLSEISIFCVFRRSSTCVHSRTLSLTLLTSVTLSLAKNPYCCLNTKQHTLCLNYLKHMRACRSCLLVFDNLTVSVDYQKILFCWFYSAYILFGLLCAHVYMRKLSP